MYRVYLDALALLAVSTFVLESLTLWAVREIMAVSPRRSRVALGAMVSTAVFSAVLATLQVRALPARSGVTLGMFLASAALSNVAAFPGLSLRRSGTALIYRCLLTFMAGGAAVAVYNAAGGNQLAAYIAALATVLVVAELGWGVVHKSVRDGLFYVPIEIAFGGETLMANALLDTGNQLKDPLTGSPVIIVEHEALKPILPPDVEAVLVKAATGDLGGFADLAASSRWSSRFRVIPFSSIGQEKGMLIGVRPDEVRIVDGSSKVSTSKVVIGIHERKLSPEGTYVALLHPEVLQHAS